MVLQITSYEIVAYKVKFLTSDFWMPKVGMGLRISLIQSTKVIKFVTLNQIDHG